MLVLNEFVFNLTGKLSVEVPASLEAFEQHAFSQGIILEGRKDSFGQCYQVATRRADTDERLHLCFAMTPGMATRQAELLATLTELLAGAGNVCKYIRT